MLEWISVPIQIAIFQIAIYRLCLDHPRSLPPPPLFPWCTALRKFFVEDDTNRSDVLGPIIERLRIFLRLMEQQKLYRFFATSLLIIYEGDTRCPISKPRDLLDVRLVDFAHAFERNPNDFSEPDYNTMFGVKNFIKYLEQLDNGENADVL